MYYNRIQPQLQVAVKETRWLGLDNTSRALFFTASVIVPAGNDNLVLSKTWVITSNQNLCGKIRKITSSGACKNLSQLLAQELI